MIAKLNKRWRKSQSVPMFHRREGQCGRLEPQAHRDSLHGRCESGTYFGKAGDAMTFMELTTRAGVEGAVDVNMLLQSPVQTVATPGGGRRDRTGRFRLIRARHASVALMAVDSNTALVIDGCCIDLFQAVERSESRLERSEKARGVQISRGRVRTGKQGSHSC